MEITSYTSSDRKNLISLLNLEDDVKSEDDSYEASGIKNHCNPNFISKDISESQNESQKNMKISDYNKIIEYPSKNIWSDSEILDEEEDEANMKIKPKYEMVYQQNVTPDDIFLQLSDKGPGTDSCECLLVKIKLPGIHSKDEMNLNISRLKLICKTKKYYLNLDLPKEVNPMKCSAKWDETQNLLEVKLYF